jgi:hypothetical protein
MLMTIGLLAAPGAAGVPRMASTKKKKSLTNCIKSDLFALG